MAAPARAARARLKAQSLDAGIRRIRSRLEESWLETRQAGPLFYRREAGRTRALLAGIDERFQKLVAEKVDPVFGRYRDELASADADPATGAYERQLNRCIAAAAVSITAAVGAIVYPPLVIVTLGTALYSTGVIFRNGYQAIVRERRLRMDVMGSLYFIGLFCGGYLIPGAFSLVAYYIGEKLVLVTQDRSRKTMSEVFRQQPKTVWKHAGGADIEVPFESVRAGDSLVFQAGDVIPVDGIVIEGAAMVDQHLLTGESEPVEKGAGDPVLTATMMVSGRAVVRVEKTGEETVAAQIGAILNKTASYQASVVSKGERLADRSVAPSLALALVALPLSGYQSMVTILGSAIGLNIRLTAPIALLNFLNASATQGILVKDGRSLELLRDVDTVVFDKTGTLTLDELQAAQVHTLPGIDADTVVMQAAAAEHRQTHPIAKAILTEARRRGLTVPEADNADYRVGFGLSVRLDGHWIRVGSARFMADEQVPIPDSFQELLMTSREEANSLVMVAVDSVLHGAIELRPTLRPEAHLVVTELRRRKLDVCIVSGDHEQPTRRIAAKLGISRYFYDTLPAGKAAIVKELQREGRSVCFVGDGINDTIALKSAHVSISLRGSSTAATDTAQIVFMSQSLSQLPLLFDLARDLENNMNAGAFAAISQGVVIIGGAMFGVVGIVGGTVIWLASLFAGLGLAMRPVRKHAQSEIGVR